MNNSAAADAYASSLNHVPLGQWKFDEEVSSCFDDMLMRSIPEYEAMRRAVFAVGSTFVRPGTDILDIGCSHGAGVESFLNRFGAEARYVLADNSESMLDRVRDRYKGWIDAQIMRVEACDLGEALPFCRPSLILSVLTLQFVPVEKRIRTVQNCIDKLEPGGALVIVEKVLGSGSLLDQTFSRIYWQMKERNGYSKESIEAKRRSLENVMVPLMSEWNERMLAGAGFSQIDCFWRWMNFSAWVAVKS